MSRCEVADIIVIWSKNSRDRVLPAATLSESENIDHTKKVLIMNTCHNIWTGELIDTMQDCGITWRGRTEIRVVQCCDHDNNSFWWLWWWFLQMIMTVMKQISLMTVMKVTDVHIRRKRSFVMTDLAPLLPLFARLCQSRRLRSHPMRQPKNPSYKCGRSRRRSDAWLVSIETMLNCRYKCDLEWWPMVTGRWLSSYSLLCGHTIAFAYFNVLPLQTRWSHGRRPDKNTSRR